MRKNKLRNLLIKGISTLIIILLVFFIINYIQGYNVLNTNASLSRNISRQRYSDSYNVLTIRDKVKIDDQLIVYYTDIGNNEGFAILEQGSNLCYRLHTSGYTTDLFVKTSNNKRYAVIFGENKNNYTKIKFEIAGTNYQQELPNKDYFIIYQEVPFDSTNLTANFHETFE